nr:immunoglobulin light chain junction region [Macaca mulatta]MPO03595.1 immunoglobulin light chain junction region [Macaca mulatta]MPO04870.1 immunoglobulin light chain junction region [Macaca mulatta]MPO05153.1 immunoglobulin light chain junction region [Macaca mulatta]MPO05907.1 immunoglobulin light chain junction region [Macaca mulatta]
CAAWDDTLSGYIF